MILLFPFGILYGTVMEVRNLFYNTGIFKSIKTPKPSISVGNLSVGGTGKTPAIKFLLKELGEENSLVISRGYGRKSKGYYEVTLDKDTSITSDEPKEIKTAFPKSKVVVCEKRTEAIAKTKGEQHIRILFDDLFQHRSVQTNCNILLSSYHAPFFKDFVLPAGNLREFSWNKKRADIITITKCPENLEPKEADSIRKKVASNASIFFSSIHYGEVNWNSDALAQPKKVICLSSIAKADLFIKEVENRFDSVLELSFQDHHNYSERDIKSILDKVKTFGAQAIITTAKDMAKLKEFSRLLSDIPVGIIHAEMNILFDQKEEFIKNVKNLTK